MERTVFLNGFSLNGNEWIKFYFKILLPLLQVPAGYVLSQTICICIKGKGRPSHRGALYEHGLKVKGSKL